MEWLLPFDFNLVLFAVDCKYSTLLSHLELTDLLENTDTDPPGSDSQETVSKNLMNRVHIKQLQVLISSFMNTSIVS